MFVVAPLPSGCVAAVGDKDGFLYLSTPGNFTYGEPAPVTHFSPPMTNTVCLINGAFIYHNTSSLCLWFLFPDSL